MSSASQALRARIHSSIRRSDIQSILKRIRFPLEEHQPNRLSELLSETHLSRNQLDDLLYFINQGESNAIAHLGNLIIDGNITQLATICASLQPRNASHYWFWLIRVLSERGSCSPAILHEVASTLHIKNDPNKLSHCLRALYNWAVQGEPILALVSTASIYSLTYHIDSSVYLVAYKLVALIASNQQWPGTTNIWSEGPHKNGQACPPSISVLLHGLAREDSIAHKYVITILTSLLNCSGCLPDILALKLLSLTEQGPNQSVRQALACFWRTVSAYLPCESLVSLVDRGLFSVLAKILPNHNETNQLSLDISQCIKNVYSRCDGCPEFILRQIQWNRLQKLLHETQSEQDTTKYSQSDQMGQMF